MRTLSDNSAYQLQSGREESGQSLSSIISYRSPIGTLLIEASARGISRVTCNSNAIQPQISEDAIYTSRQAQLHLESACSALTKYFSGKMEALAFVPLDVKSSSFGSSVFDAARHIPPAKTVGYRELASSLGNPSAQRAVARALAANPIPLFIPCHRVIHSNGTLGGYSFAEGVKTKAFLLELERGCPLYTHRE